MARAARMTRNHSPMHTIVVAGATGDLGGRIVRALAARGATVRALTRREASQDQRAALQAAGAEAVPVDCEGVAALTAALRGAECLVSAVSGLADVIVGLQTRLLDAAVAAGVPRFIPSDFSLDFTHLAPGSNRNFDLRRDFRTRLDQAPIRATSIFNGAFAERDDF